MNLKEEIDNKMWHGSNIINDDRYFLPIEDATEIAESYAKEVACRFAGWYSIIMEFDFHPDHGWRNINTGETYKTIDDLFKKWWEENK